MGLKVKADIEFVPIQDRRHITTSVGGGGTIPTKSSGGNCGGSASIDSLKDVSKIADALEHHTARQARSDGIR